jgi:hypothetical protein
MPLPTGAKSDVVRFAPLPLVLLSPEVLALGVLLSVRAVGSLFVDVTRGTWLGRWGLNGGGFRLDGGYVTVSFGSLRGGIGTQLARDGWCTLLDCEGELKGDGKQPRPSD